jgi:hypothetical protein
MFLKRFTKFDVFALKINHLFSLCLSTIGLARPVIARDAGVLSATLDLLENANTAMGEQMNKSTVNPLTDEIVALDVDRDERFAEIRRLADAWAKSRDAAKKAAAVNFLIFLDPYRDIARMALNTQTGVMTEMLGKYNADETLKTQAATIGVAEMMTALEAANTAFGAAYQARYTGEAAEGPSASSLKRDLVEAYTQFCTALEQAVSFAPTGELETLFGQMDELRKTYARLPSGGEGEEEPPAAPAE